MHVLHPFREGPPPLLVTKTPENAGAARWLLPLCVVASATCALLPFSNPDLYWHLSAGARILAERAVPTQDWLSFTRAGAPWVDFEWLAQVLWQLALRAGGWWGLLLLKAGCLAAAGWALWKTLELYGRPPASRAAWLLAWALALLPANDLRPENFSIALFGLEWWWLERDRLGGPRRLGTPELVLAAAAFMLWANLHAGFAYGLGLLALAAVTAEPERRLRLAAVLGAAVAGTLANPAGYRLYPVLMEHARGLGELSVLIREWQPPTLRDPWLWPFWALLFTAFGAILRRQLRLNLPRLHLLAVCLLGISAARHVRTAPYFAAVAVPAAAVAFAEWHARWRRGAAYAAVAGLLLFWGARVAPQLRAEPVIPRYAPEGVARFLSANAELFGSRRMFNPSDWGGFLAWRLGPGFPVFADGRYLFHPLMRRVAEAREKPGSFGALLDEHGVDLLVLKNDPGRVVMEARTKDHKRVVLSRPAYLFYAPRTVWALVFWDRDGMVFVRRSRIPESWLKANEYALWRPGDLEAAHLQIKEGLATRALLDAERARLERAGVAP